MNSPTDPNVQPTAFRRFWQAHAVSAVGTGLGAGALPIIAILVLHASAFEVSILAAVGAVSSAVISVPMGSLIEASEKRIVMIVSNLARFIALGTVPVAIVFGALTFAHLCTVAVMQTTGAIAYNAASFAYVKAVVPTDQRTAANARMDSVNWITQSAGPPAGGALIAATTPFATVIIDSLSYVAATPMLRRIPAAVPADRRTTAAPERGRLLAGWAWIFREPTLRTLYLNAMIFGGTIMWASPLLAVLILQQMHASPIAYGIALGVPALGGLLGATLSPRLVTRIGQRRALLAFGLARVPWLLALPLAGPGSTAIAIITVSQFLLLTAAGLFNPVFSTYRMQATPDDLMARVSAAWSVSSKSIQPAFITIGGIVAALTSTRTSLLAAAVLCLLSGLFLHGPAKPATSRNWRPN